MPISTAAQWQCGVCGTLYRAWLSRCQRCHGPGPTEENPLMPKTTRAVGPTIDGEPVVVAQGGGEVEQPVAVGVPAAPPESTDADELPPAQPDATPQAPATVPAPDPHAAPGTADAATVAPEPPRPPVNASKGDHTRYAATVYGNDQSWWDDEYSKRDLIKTLDKLAAGEAEFTDGKVVDMTDPSYPDPDAPVVPDPDVPDVPGDGDNDGTAGEGTDDDIDTDTGA